MASSTAALQPAAFTWAKREVTMSRRALYLGWVCLWHSRRSEQQKSEKQNFLSWKTKFLALIGKYSNTNLKHQASAMQKGFNLLTCHTQLWLEAGPAPVYRAPLPGSCLCPVLRGVPAPHRRHQDSPPHWHVLEPDLGQQSVCSSAPAGKQGLACLDGGARWVWAAMWDGPGDNETIWHCTRVVPCVPDTSGVSQQAAPQGLTLCCLRQAGAGEPHWGKEVAKSSSCSWQHGHSQHRHAMDSMDTHSIPCYWRVPIVTK